MKLKVPHYYQTINDYACGPTCIRMVIDYFLKKRGEKSKKNDWESIVQDTMNGSIKNVFGTNKKNLKKALQKRGFSCRNLVGNTQTRLHNLYVAISNGTPAILGCRADVGNLRDAHYIVLTGINKYMKYIYINDPYPKKPSKIKLDSFLKNGQKISWGNSKWGIIVDKT